MRELTKCCWRPHISPALWPPPSLLLPQVNSITCHSSTKINQRPRKAISALKKATVSINRFEWHRERKTFRVSLKKHVLIFFYYLHWLSGKGQKPKTHKWYHFSDHTEIKPITAVFGLQRHAVSISLLAAIELFSNTWKPCSGAGLMSEE